jgi:hypothetical protein
MSKKLAINKSKNQDNKNKMLLAITLILLLTVSGLMASFPITTAHTPKWDIPTVSYVSVAPNPVGVGQTAYVIVWLDMIPPTAQGPNGDRWTFYVNITDPSGGITTLGPLTSDDLGGSYTKFVPDKLGTYTLESIFPGQTLAGDNPPLYPNGVPFVGDYFEPCVSRKISVTVQQDRILDYPYTPLPADNTYWQPPIQGNNKAWSVLGGSWLMANYDAKGLNFNPYTTAPQSAHILWTKPFTLGGQIGGAVGNEQTQFDGVDQYQAAFSPAIIINGMLYYNQYTVGKGLPGIVGVNLRTGETQWVSNGSGVPITTALSLDQPGVVYDNNTFNRLTLGQVFNYVSPNQYGANTYLWAINGVSGTLRYDMYDAFTGAYMLSLVNCSSGTFTYGPNGELLCYILNVPGNWLAMWNSSKVEGMLGGTYGNVAWQWRPHTGQKLDWRTGLQWNATISAYTQPFSETIFKVSEGVILASTLSTYGATPQTWVLDIAYDANTGREMWVQNRTLAGPTVLYSSLWTGPPAGDGIFTHFDKNTLTMYAYDMKTGNQIWSSDAFKSDSLAYYNNVFTMGYGNIYVASYGGYIYCLDKNTGTLKWSTSTGSSGSEFPGGANWPINVWSGKGVGWALADGKLYVSTGHAYNPPMFNGAKMYCFDAKSGDLIYTAPGWWEMSAVAYGELVSFNGYDNQIYAFGKGLSATTVTATPGVGNAVTIQGTVTDQSPGQTCVGIPAAGTPAISDESMSQWMAYLYMQQPKPTNATGVTVHLTALDPNGNTQDLGYATSDASGLYSIMWTPPVQGKYVITASFDGTNSYYASSGETALGVGATVSPVIVAPTPTQTATSPASPTSTPTQSPASPSPSIAPQPTSGTPVTTYVAVAAAVVIIAVAAAVLVLRRRK